MTNGELIEELSRYPRHLPVKVVLSHVYTGGQEGVDREDAITACRVIHEGAFLLIESE